MSYGYRSTPETLRFQPIPPFIFPYSPFKKEQKTDIKTSCWHCGLGYLDITKYKPSFIIFMFKRKIFSKNCEKILLQSILVWFEPTLTTNFFILYHYHCFPCVLLMQRGLLIINFSSKNIKFIVVFHKIPTTIVYKFQRIRFLDNLFLQKINILKIKKPHDFKQRFKKNCFFPSGFY